MDIDRSAGELAGALARHKGGASNVLVDEFNTSGNLCARPELIDARVEQVDPRYGMIAPPDAREGVLFWVFLCSGYT